MRFAAISSAKGSSFDRFVELMTIRTEMKKNFVDGGRLLICGAPVSVEFCDKGAMSKGSIKISNLY